jgi:hypothetical protein
VRAALVVIKDGSLHNQGLVLTGHVPLLVAANQVRRRHKAELITADEAVAAWRLWSPAQRAEFGRGAGISEIWDNAIIPVMSEERASQQAAE